MPSLSCELRFDIPPLPRAPHVCPTCRMPFWSQWAVCSGLRLVSGRSHPATPTVPLTEQESHSWPQAM